MLRWIGALLVSAALASAGFVCAALETRRLHAIEDALRAVELLRGQVLHLLQPLPRAVSALAPQNALLRRLEQAGCLEQEGALRAELLRAGLGSAQASMLVNLFRAIPRLSAGQGAPFDAAAEQLAAQLAAQQKAVGQSAALYPRLGVLAGVAAFLLLI